MIILVGFFTWIIAIFTNIYIYKLLYGTKLCIFDQTRVFKTVIIIFLAPFISIVLFVKYIIKISCEISKYILSSKKRSCDFCVNYMNGKCSIYDLNVRKDMLCKSEFYVIKAS